MMDDTLMTDGEILGKVCRCSAYGLKLHLHARYDFYLCSRLYEIRNCGNDIHLSQRL